jgi:hypothetical protein
MSLAIGAVPFAPNILIDPLISSLFYLSFYSMTSPKELATHKHFSTHLAAVPVTKNKKKVFMT